MQPKIYKFSDGEYHMMGDSVAVYWHVKAERREILHNGTTYSAIEHVRYGKPGIDFVWIRERDGVIWIDDDSPVDGGIDSAFAATLITELQAAIEYIKQQPQP